MTKNPVVHFEMPADDRQRMADFYTKAFGWETHMLGPEMGNYVTVTTTDTDEQRMVKTPGTINGGFFQRVEEKAHPCIVISVEDIHVAITSVKEAGGTVLSEEPDAIPGVGLYASFIDTEGNRVGMLQSKRD